MYLRLSFVTVFGIVCRHSCRHIHPVWRLLPQNGSEASLNIAISVVVAARVRCQRGASPAIAVITHALTCVYIASAGPPPPLPSLHMPNVRVWPRGGRESKWMMSSVPGIPLELGQLRQINLDFSTNLLLG